MRKEQFRLNMSNTLNRGMVITAFPNDEPLPFSVMFNKKTSGLEVQYNTRSDLILDKGIKVRLNRNLSSCMFSNIFFNLDSIQDDKRDHRTKFLGVNPLYRDVIFQFSAEKLELRASTDYKERDGTNYIMITGWKLYDLESDIIFFFVQRKLYNLVSRISVIRTMGVQFTTKRGFDVLNKYDADFKKHLLESEKPSRVMLPSYMKKESEMSDEEKLFD